MQDVRSEGEIKKVLMFLSRGFEDLEAVTVIDVLGWTEYREHLPTVNLATTGFHDEVEGRFGMKIRPSIHIRDVNPDEYSALAIPGGFYSYGFEEVFDPALYDVARRIHGRGGTIATMCVGVLPVAEAGLLRGRRATTYNFSRNHDNPRRLQDLGCEPAGVPLEVSDRIISCSGPAQSLKVALLLLEAVAGEEAASEVARYLNGLDSRRYVQERVSLPENIK